MRALKKSRPQQAGKANDEQNKGKDQAGQKAAVDIPEPESSGFWGRIIGRIKRWAREQGDGGDGLDPGEDRRRHPARPVRRVDARHEGLSGALKNQQARVKGVADTGSETTDKASAKQDEVKSTSVKETAEAEKSIAEADTNIQEAYTFLQDINGFEQQLKAESTQAHQFITQITAEVLGAKTDSLRKMFYFKYFEQWFSRKADYISITNILMKDNYYPEFHHKIVEIPQGFNFEESRSRLPVYRPNPVPTFAFAGTFFTSTRDPRALFEYLCGLKLPFKFLVFSAQRSLVDPYVSKSEGRIELRELLPREQLLPVLSGMEFVVNTSYDEKVQSPSKLIDYYLVDRPVLSLQDYTYEVWSESQADKYYFELLENCQVLSENQNFGKNYNEISKEIFG